MKGLHNAFFVICALLLHSCGIAISVQPAGDKLNLNRKGLQEIPEYVFEMKELRKLSLYGNKLEIIDDRIGELTHLEELYLGNNQLKELPVTIGQLKNLKILSVQYNQLANLPSEIGDLGSLEQLILNQNQIHSLPPEIGQLEKLESLQLKFNWLDSLPRSIGNCSSLKFIFLNRNQLTTLPDEMGKISGLQEVYLSGAGYLLQVPESFCSLRRLEILEVDQLAVIPNCLLVYQTNRLRIIRRF